MLRLCERANPFASRYWPPTPTQTHFPFGSNETLCMRFHNSWSIRFFSFHTYQKRAEVMEKKRVWVVIAGWDLCELQRGGASQTQIAAIEDSSVHRSKKIVDTGIRESRADRTHIPPISLSLSVRLRHRRRKVLFCACILSFHWNPNEPRFN